MKMYVDELPRSCGDCEFFKANTDCYYCDKLHMKLGYINKEKDCPLQSLAEYNKQVRKEVLDELCNMLGDRAELIDFGHNVSEFMFSVDDLQECSKAILDQIQEDR